MADQSTKKVAVAFFSLQKIWRSHPPLPLVFRGRRPLLLVGIRSIFFLGDSPNHSAGFFFCKAHLNLGSQVKSCSSEFNNILWTSYRGEGD